MQRHSHLTSRMLPLVAALWGIACAASAQEEVKIDGMATDAAGRPLAGITLSFSVQRDNRWERVNLESDETGKMSGTATFEGDPPSLRIGAPQDLGLVPVRLEGDVGKVKTAYRFEPNEEGNVRFTLQFDEPPSRVTGAVTGPEGEPVANAVVTIYRHHDRNAAPPIGVLGIFDVPRSIEAETDDAGRFSMAVVGGQHLVSSVVTEPGSLLYWDRRSGGYRQAYPAAGETFPMDLELSQGGSYVLRVLDEDGKPVPGAAIGSYRGARGATPPAGEDGVISSGGLQPGLYKLTVTPPGGSPLAPGTVPVRVEIGKVASHDVVLPRGATLAVCANYENGKPAADLAFFGDHATDTEGRFVLNGLPAGDVTVALDTGKNPMLRLGDADAAGKVTTQVVNGGEFVLPLTVLPVGTIAVKGRVTGPDGKGVAGVEVSATGSGDRRPVDDRPEPVTTDAEGNYSIEGVFPGTVRVAINPPEDMPVSVDPKQLTIADVAQGADVTKNVKLQKGSLLRVRLLDAEGAPLENSYVSMTDVRMRGKKREEKSIGGGWMGRTSRSDEDGWLVLRLPHRDFREGDRRFVEFRQYQGAPHWKPSRIDLSPTNGEMIEAEVRRQRLQTVSGVATGQDGKPVYGARIRLVTLERYKTWGMRGLGNRLESVTDEEGRFEIANVAAGEYWFGVVLPSDRHLDLAEKPPVKVRIQTGKDVERNIAFPLAGRIEGSVTGANGATLAAYVSAMRKLPGARHPTSFGMPIPSDPGAERGYRISRLAPGKYTLNVRITAIPGVKKPDYKKLSAFSKRAPKPTVEVRAGETTRKDIVLKK